MQQYFQKIIPHILVFIGFVVLSLAYFNPVLSGKKIFQSDIQQYAGMSKQQTDYRKQTGQETYWTNSAFGGMPTYQLGAKYPHNYIKKLDLTIRFLPRPADYLFLYFLAFYILLLALKLDFKLAALGAIAFGFSTYLVIILGVGHNSKALAIGYMPLVLSGIILTFRQKYIFGFLVTAVAMGLQLAANHYQMTYYLLLLVLILGIVYLIDAYKKKALPHYFKSVLILTFAVMLGIALNATNILATYEYANESTRGKSELTIQPNGKPKPISTGLDKNYITEYSYGLLETFNLFIPRLLGGGNSENLGKDSHTYEAFRKIGASPAQALEQAKYAPMYWGKQPIVEAPAYIGAVVIFLFVFALFLVKDRLKWWLVGSSLLALILSYGKTEPFALITNFFIDYFPFYNKFRAVTSIQVIIELCLPILAIFGLYRLFNNFENKEEKFKALKLSTTIAVGITVLFLIAKWLGWLDFAGINDSIYRQNYGLQFVDAIKEDRKAIFTKDTFRTLILVLLSAATIFGFLKKKLSEKAVVLIFGVLVLFDLVGVNRRYVNNDDFVPAIQVNKLFTATNADKEILKDTAYFRVLDVTSSDARASYFHNSLNGYHAAKLRRFNDILDFYIVRNNINVLNMLNTKYIIAKGENGIFPFENIDANGNAWFVKELKMVNSVNDEILALDSLDTKLSAIQFDTKISSNPGTVIYDTDSLATINLVTYKPNYLKYKSENNKDGLAVFSEIYYKNGWNAYINGKLKPHFRVNYILRALEIPAGKHTIEFKFEPEVVKTGSKIALGSSILLVILLLGGGYFSLKKKR